MTSSRTLAFVAALAVAAPVVVPRTASAQSATDLETARDLYKQGKEMRARGDLTGALAKLKVAHELGRTPLTGIEYARTLEMVGQIVEAREVCLGIARIPVASDETERSAAARTDAAKLAESLRPRIASVYVRVEGAPQGRNAIVMIDRIVVPEDTLREARKVNPGKHEVVAKLPRGAEVSEIVELKEGEGREVRLHVPPEPPEATTSPGLPPGVTITPAPQPQPQPGQPAQPGRPPPAEHHGVNGLVVGGFILGGAGLLVGTITGLVAINKANDLERTCPNKQCPLEEHGAIDQSKAMGTVATVSFVVAGVGAALVVVGIATSGKSDETRTGKLHVAPWLGPGSGGAGVTGAF